MECKHASSGRSLGSCPRSGTANSPWVSFDESNYPHIICGDYCTDFKGKRYCAGTGNLCKLAEGYAHMNPAI